jgi:hypothetical protein
MVPNALNHIIISIVLRNRNSERLLVRINFYPNLPRQSILYHIMKGSISVFITHNIISII